MVTTGNQLVILEMVVIGCYRELYYVILSYTTMMSLSILIFKCYTEYVDVQYHSNLKQNPCILRGENVKHIMHRLAGQIDFLFPC